MTTTWLLDAGNTRLKAAALSAAGELGPVHTIEYAGAGDWLAELSDARAAWVSCVAAPAVRAMLAAALKCPTHWAATPTEGLGLRCAYRDHRKWGVDRFLGLAAARAQTLNDQPAAPRGCAVISIGTAATLDICNAQGQHLGGWIAPGPEALMSALGSRTALPQAAEALPDKLRLATDTEEAILLGALQSAIGGIERAVAVAQEQGIEQIAVTGGGLPFLQPYLCELPLRPVPHLVLAGLRLYQAQWSSAG